MTQIDEARERLLPCPFCGCKAVWFKTGRDIGIECQDGFDCPGRAQTNVYAPEHRQDVVDQWNRRAAAPAAEPVLWNGWTYAEAGDRLRIAYDAVMRADGVKIRLDIKRLGDWLVGDSTYPETLTYDPAEEDEDDEPAAEPALVQAARDVIRRHDEWAKQMPTGEFDDPLSEAIAALRRELGDV